MPQVESTYHSNIPGVRLEDIFKGLDDSAIEHLLPDGAFQLIRIIDEKRTNGPNRSKYLSQILSLELAVDDPSRREILLNAVPENKVGELEKRVGLSLDNLKSEDVIEHSARKEILGFFGLAIINDRSSPVTKALKSVNPNRGLFPHQKKAASEVERYLYHEEGRVMLHLPTGVGKTRTAMSIVASHLRRRSMGLVLWLATTRELLEQAAEEFESTWATVGDREVNCLRYWAQYNPPIDKITDGIVVCGLAKLHSYAKDRQRLWNLGDRITMVVFDEAHQAVAETYQDIVCTVVTRKPRTPLLGLSATPGRTWSQPEVDQAVAELFQSNKVTLEFDGVNPIKFLTEKGYLASVDFSLLNVEPGLQLSSEDLKIISKSLDLPKKIAERLGEDERRNLRIVQRILELSEKHNRILVFAASVTNALLLASICRGVGLKADAVTGKTETHEREIIIQQFKRLNDSKRILINFGVLTTGFDAPVASEALIARPTKSLVLYSQMVGRVIRGPKAGGTNRCEVVTVVDTTLPGFGDVAEAFTNWEDIWNTG